MLLNIHHISFKPSLLLAASLCIAQAMPAEDWMADIDDGAYITQLSIPGSHDSCTGNGWASGLGAIFGPGMGTTQDLTLEEQWEAGIRAFDLRPCVLDGALEIYHGILQTNTSFASALETLCRLLDEHPTEFAIVTMRHESDADKNDASWAGLMKDATQAPDVASHLVALTKDLTLGEARGKILMMTRDSFGNRNVSAISGWSHSAEFADQIKARISCTRGNLPLYCQDIFECTGEIDADRKLQAVLTMLDASSKLHLDGDSRTLTIVINHTSGYTKSASSDGNRELAAKTNTGLYDALTADDFVAGPTGIVLMDFCGCDESNGYAVNSRKLTDALIANNSKYTPKGETDALTAMETDSESLSDGKIYDLTGRQISGDLSTLPPGLYIINHKKVLIR